MSGCRGTATVVGVLYVAGTLAGVLSAVVTSGALDGPDYLASASASGNRLAAGALLVLIMGLALALIPVLMFPILRRTSERLALGYLVFRGALETVTYIVVAASWLLLFQLGRDYVPGGADATGLRASGVMLKHAAETGSLIGLTVFPLGALMFYSVLYRSRLVPRWLSGWGLVALVPYLDVALLELFAVVSPSSTTESMLVLPLGLQEMVLAVWLIVRGFSCPADSSSPNGEARTAPYARRGDEYALDSA
jgi:hypothetical protein